MDKVATIMCDITHRTAEPPNLTDRARNERASDQRGITGLETAIILIAFVVVASVFAFTILSSGVFAAERSKQSIHAGLQDTRSSITPKGSALAFSGYDATAESAVYKVSFTVANAVGGQPVDMTPPYSADGTGTDPDVDAGAEYVTVISYSDQYQYLPDVPWTVTWVGHNNGDNLLEVGEAAEVTVWLMDQDTSVAVTATSSVSVMNGTSDGGGDGGIDTSGTLLMKNREFSIEMKPPRGAIVSVDRTTPPSLRTVMQLR
jgi:archaeal flagellin FlaB